MGMMGAEASKRCLEMKILSSKRQSKQLHFKNLSLLQCDDTVLQEKKAVTVLLM